MNDNNVVKLSVVSAPKFDGAAPNPDVIDSLERMLKRAKSGEMRAFAMAYSADDGEGGSVPATSMSVHFSGDLCKIAAGLLVLNLDVAAYIRNGQEKSPEPKEPGDGATPG